eukprot:5496463-Amphidinium_carterae.1
MFAYQAPFPPMYWLPGGGPMYPPATMQLTSMACKVFGFSCHNGKEDIWHMVTTLSIPSGMPILS